MVYIHKALCMLSSSHGRHTLHCTECIIYDCYLKYEGAKVDNFLAILIQITAAAAAARAAQIHGS